MPDNLCTVAKQRAELVIRVYTCAVVAWARIVGVPNAYQTSWSDLARYLLFGEREREKIAHC